jgi:Putative addiction module component
MSMTLEALETEVFRLSPSDRSRLLEHLIANLDNDEEMEAAWDAIAARREADVESGAAALIPFEAALTRLEARFAA